MSGYRCGLRLGAGLLLALFAFSIGAQAPMRVRGTVEAVEGRTIQIRSREGDMLKVQLADNATIAAVVKASLADIKANSFVGVAAMRQPNGSQRALEVLIFPDAMRGANEGHYPWDLMPESTMTNATVIDSVTKVDGATLTLKYKDGEQTIVVPPEAPIVTFAPGSRDDLKKGAGVFIGAARKQPDGTYQAGRINVGRDIAPPM
jgi:hypothetical protein